MADFISGEEHHRVSSTKPNKSYQWPKLTPIILIVIVALVIGFVGGIEYQKGHNASQTSGTAQGGRRTRNPNLVLGTVSSVSPTSITVTSRFNNASSTLNITSSTQIEDSGQSVSVSDIQTGELVAITKTSSTSQDAASIVLNPSFGGGFGGSSSSSSSPSVSN